MLGAGLDGNQVSPRLKARLDRVLKLKLDSTVGVLVSGGQGPDEKISEAEAMKRYLMASGMPEQRILLEDRSTSTVENLRYCLELMQKKKLVHKKLLIVTSDYHVLRVKILSAMLGLKAEVAGCESNPRQMAQNVFREYFSLLKSMAQIGAD